MNRGAKKSLLALILSVLYSYFFNFDAIYTLFLFLLTSIFFNQKWEE